MNPKPLVNALLAAAAFLEEGTDDMVDPDWAVTTMENMGAALSDVPEDEVAELLAAFEEIAAQAERKGQVSWARFVRNQPLGFGLVERPD